MRAFVITERLTAKGQRASELYKQDVSKIPLLTPEQEYEVALKAQEGDEEAVEQLVESNLRFVISVAKMYTREAATMEDLIQVGNIGLVESARKFDPSKGFKFISYAVWHIRKEMIKYLGDNSRIVRFPQNKGQLVSKVREGYSDLYSQLGREPTPIEIIDWVKEKTPQASNLDEDTLRVILATDIKATSLDAKFDSDDSSSPTKMDLLDSGSLDVNDEMYSDHQNHLLQLLLRVLSPYEEYAIREYFGMNDLKFERSTPSIAFDLESTSEAVRVRIKKALRQMQREANRLGINIRDVMSR